jgi:hypothetical protein
MLRLRRNRITVPRARTLALIAALPALTLAVALPTAQGANGAAEAATVCEWYDKGLIEPPLSMTPGTHTYSTRGETGKITCNGKIMGHKPTGPGTVGFEARMGPTTKITCVSGGVGDYVAFFTFPIAGGKKMHGVEYGNFAFGLKDGKFGGSYKGTLFTGTFESGIVKGDCEKGVTKVFFRTTDAKVAKHARKIVIPAGL